MEPLLLCSDSHLRPTLTDLALELTDASASLRQQSCSDSIHSNKTLSGRNLATTNSRRFRLQGYLYLDGLVRFGDLQTKHSYPQHGGPCNHQFRHRYQMCWISVWSVKMAFALDLQRESKLAHQLKQENSCHYTGINLCKYRFVVRSRQASLLS